MPAPKPDEINQISGNSRARSCSFTACFDALGKRISAHGRSQDFISPARSRCRCFSADKPLPTIAAYSDKMYFPGAQDNFLRPSLCEAASSRRNPGLFGGPILIFMNIIHKAEGRNRLLLPSAFKVVSKL